MSIGTGGNELAADPSSCVTIPPPPRDSPGTPGTVPGTQELFNTVNPQGKYSFGPDGGCERPASRAQVAMEAARDALLFGWCSKITFIVRDPSSGLWALVPCPGSDGSIYRFAVPQTGDA